MRPLSSASIPDIIGSKQDNWDDDDIEDDFTKSLRAELTKNA